MSVAPEYLRAPGRGTVASFALPVRQSEVQSIAGAAA